MEPTGERAERAIGDATWQPPLEADPADVGDQRRGLIDATDEGGDPEAPVTTSGAERVRDLDLLSRASEADVAEQLSEVPFDDDTDR